MMQNTKESKALYSPILCESKAEQCIKKAHSALLNKRKSYPKTEIKAKDLADLGMSNDPKPQKTSEFHRELPKANQNKHNDSSSENKIRDKVPDQKDNPMMSELKRFISNPTPGINNLNNYKLTSYIEKYKAQRQKEISLASKVNDPLKHEDLKEGIKRARFIKLQAEKKDKLCPTIFDVEGGMSGPSTDKTKQPREKTPKVPSKLKTQNSLHRVQADLSSDDKECHSQRSGGSTTLRKDNSEVRTSKEVSSAKHSGRNIAFTDEAPLSNEYFENQIVSLEPKDVADRTLCSFERYLGFVNSMYFGRGAPEPHETLNEVASRMSSSGNELLTSKAIHPAEGGPKNTQQGSSLVSTDFHYSTLDMLCNPLRVPLGFETWSPLEIAIFETCICKFGTNFDLFAKFIKTKSPREITNFYFLWKKTSCYKIWSQKMESCLEEDRNDWVFR